jgi:hypothetical protein
MKLLLKLLLIPLKVLWWFVKLPYTILKVLAYVADKTGMKNEQTDWRK